MEPIVTTELSAENIYGPPELSIIFPRDEKNGILI